MPLDWNNIANNAIGQGMGLLLGKVNDRRQINQQQKLQNMQIKGQKEMMDYGQNQQYQMWLKTNYGPQMEQMKKAGLNPGLMYGMGGGGGATTGGASGNVSGGSAPVGGGEAQGMGIAMMQAQLMKAQKENIEADTENKKADNPNYPLKGANLTADTKLKGDQGVETRERALSLTYDNIIKDLIVNRDEKGNLVEEDKDRLAFKQQTADYLKKTMESAGISQQIQTQIAQIAQKWKQLSLDERMVQLNEAVQKANLGNKDQDQIIQVISMIINNLTHGLINFGKKGAQVTDNSYRPHETHIHN